MDTEYIMIIGAAVAIAAMTMLIMYLIYRRGIAVRLTVILQTFVAITAVVSVILGKEGLTPTMMIVAALVQTPAYIGMLVMVAKQIVNPAKQMAAVAEAVAQGDIDQQVTLVRRDEFGDLANAFRDMVAYLQEMADAADRLAQGDLGADVTPRSDKDRLGNAFRQMMINLREVVEDIEQTSQGLAEGDLRATPKAEYKGDFADQGWAGDGLERLGAGGWGHRPGLAGIGRW
jgi:methyl-accepting chemotaxis protein